MMTTHHQIAPGQITHDQIIEALRDCYEPELGLNIVELGLVLKVDTELDADAPGHGIAGVPDRSSITVQLLTVNDEEGSRAQLAAIVHNRLAGLPQLSRIQVEVLTDQVWTTALLSEQARQKLEAAAGKKAAAASEKAAAAAFPILNNRAR